MFFSKNVIKLKYFIKLKCIPSIINKLNYTYLINSQMQKIQKMHFFKNDE